MKKLYTITLALLFSQVLPAQITVDQNDFASAGDNVLVSNGDITAPVDIITTGANQTWDFSFLTPQSQDTLAFLPLSSTNSNYSLYFINVSFNANRSNIATPGAAIPVVPGIPITISDPYNFYYKNTNDYRQQGIGATISGFATPIAYGNKDYVYNFPLDFTDSDSCNSDWSIAIPGLGYYGYNQKRVNNVDGWGTVTTPFGTFNALRMVSVIEGADTLYADTLGMGFSFARPLTKEYKWIAKNEKIPVMQITTTDVGGSEIVSSIVYPDSLRISTGIENLTINNSFDVFPNPASDFIHLSFSITNTQQITISVMDITGKIIYHDENKRYAAGSHNKLISTRFMAEGIYSIQLTSTDGIEIKKVVVHK